MVLLTSGTDALVAQAENERLKFRMERLETLLKNQQQDLLEAQDSVLKGRIRSRSMAAEVS